MVKKALLVGINYVGSEAQLNGCVNDTVRMIAMLVKYGDYKVENIRLLTDASPTLQEKLTTEQLAVTPFAVPNKMEILQGIQWLMKDLKRGDTAFFHYSGHGTQVADRNNDEADRQDEAICPKDYEKAGFIIDDDLRKLLVDALPFGVQLIMIADACHSASMLDLPWTFQGPEWISGTKVKQWKQTGKIIPVGPKGEEKNVISLSGCRDNQTSADAWIRGQAVGALTNAFINALEDWFKIHKKMPKISKLLSLIREYLKPKIATNDQLIYTQIPQMNHSSKSFDLDTLLWSF